MALDKGTRNILIISGIIGLGGLAYWWFTRKTNIRTKDQAIDIIVKAKSGRQRSNFEGFDEWFLIEWAKAITKGKSTWVSQTKKTHSTDTGKVVTS